MAFGTHSSLCGEGFRQGEPVLVKLLDLFCGAGGAAVGYSRAGFDVIGVDVEHQRNYPFSRYTEDALYTLDRIISRPDLWDVQAIHASPPCQPYSYMSACRPNLADSYPALVEQVRAKLMLTGLPYVIENVPGAPLINPVLLCGRMFGKDLYRHRLFELCGFDVEAPDHPAHLVPASKAGHWTPGTVMSVAGHFAPVEHGRRIMDIDWMNREEMAEAVPPFYTEFIGAALYAACEKEAAA
jgi:DNA (cytosine-5)-methyltransferase 1